MSDDLAPQGQDAPTSDAPQTGDQQTAATPAFDERLDARLSEITNGIPDLVSQAMSQFYADNAQDDEEDDEPGLEPGDDGYDEQEAARFLREQIAQGVQEHIAPWQAQQLERDRDNAYNDLMRQLPELADTEKAQPYVEQAYELAQEINPQMVGTPAFVTLIGLMYKSAKADERAAQETPADGHGTPLESQAGAAPQGDEESDEDRLLKLAKQPTDW